MSPALSAGSSGPRVASARARCSHTLRNCWPSSLRRVDGSAARSDQSRAGRPPETLRAKKRRKGAASGPDEVCCRRRKGPLRLRWAPRRRIGGGRGRRVRGGSARAKGRRRGAREDCTGERHRPRPGKPPDTLSAPELPREMLEIPAAPCSSGSCVPWRRTLRSGVVCCGALHLAGHPSSPCSGRTWGARPRPHRTHLGQESLSQS